MLTSLLTTLFTITAQPGTDIWRKPPSTDVFNAPTSHAQTQPLSTFRSARVSFTGTWTQRYDQAGMALSLHRPGSNGSCSAGPISSNPPPPKWVKTGIEYYQDEPRLSTVTCDAWADWSVALPAAGTAGPGEGPVTLLARREADELGTSLWVYQVVSKGNAEVLLPMRECAWVFADDGAEDWALTVAAYAARPDKSTTESLEVAFQELTVEWEGVR